MANNITNVGFSQYGADQQRIDSQRALAAALQQQSMQPIETQNAPGGWATPISPWQGLAKLTQAGAGAYGNIKAGEAQKALGEKYQTDYKAMIAKGLRQLQGSPAGAQPDPALGGGPTQPAQAPDPTGALATFGEHPGGAPFMPMVMQDLQRQQLIQSLRGGAGGQPATPAAPQGNPMGAGGASVMAPGGGAPTAPQQAQGQQGGPASGIPLETWLQVDPTGKSYVQHLAKGGESSGRVNYDQQGRAYTVMSNGQAQYLPGINARDKPEPVNLGGSTQFVNPYQQTQPLQHSLTPMQAAELPLQQGRYSFETGQPAPGPSAGAAPGPQAAPGGQPVSLPRPQGGALPGGSGPLTPKDAASLARERAEKMPGAKQATELQFQDLDRITSLAQELQGHPGLTGSTGILGMAPSRPGGNAANAEALTSALKAQISGMKLQAMRNASKTGGAVGSVTEKEWPRLENMVVALDPVKQGEEVYRQKLDELVTEIGKVRKSLGSAFETEYGQKIGGGGKLSPAEQIELEALRKQHGRADGR